MRMVSLKGIHFIYFCKYTHCRPSAAALLAEITGLMKRYEDDFDIFQGRGKLDIMDELLQTGETEIKRSSSFSVQPQILVCFSRLSRLEIVIYYSTLGWSSRAVGNILHKWISTLQKKAKRSYTLEAICISDYRECPEVWKIESKHLYLTCIAKMTFQMKS